MKSKIPYNERPFYLLAPPKVQEREVTQSGHKVIGHLVRRYLFITGSWIYHQLINLRTYKPVVITSYLENLDQFPFDNIWYYQQPYAGQGLFKAGLRNIYESITNQAEGFYVDAIRENEARLLHAHFGTEGFYNLSVKEKVGLPLITTYYGADLSRLPRSNPKWQGRYRRLFSEGDLFLVEGNFMAQSLIELGCPQEKVKVNHLGVDVNRIDFLPRSLRDKEPVRILMASSFREKKGIPYGIRAFAEAVRRNPNMKLTIIGGAKSKIEHRLMKECREIARKEMLAEKVRFLDYIPYDQYIEESSQAHIFFAPSLTASNGDSEGGAPVAIIEASASGMPIISTHHCDIPEVVRDGESGLLVREKDIESMADAIVQLASSPEAWPEMVRAGRRHIEKEYNLQTQIGKLEQIYDRISA